LTPSGSVALTPIQTTLKAGKLRRGTNFSSAQSRRANQILRQVPLSRRNCENHAKAFDEFTMLKREN
jgi:hypothetical protein